MRSTAATAPPLALAALGRRWPATSRRSGDV
jgi:hypothetical protein